VRAKTKKRIARDRIAKAKKNGHANGNGVATDATDPLRQTGIDYFVNMVARMGWGSPSLTEGTDYEMVRLSNNYWLLLTLYRNHWLARRIVDGKAEDMVRAWPKLVSDIDPEDIKTFNRTIQRTYSPYNICRALKWARLYGGAGALIVIKGHEKILAEPLDLDDVNPGSYLGLIPFDRWVGIWPEDSELSENLRHPLEWGLPEYYNCYAQDKGQNFRVHSSRILRFTGPEIPTPELQAQLYWGISILELVYEELRKKDNASWSILQLMFRANIIARVDPTLDQFLAGLGAGTQAQQRLASVLQAQNEILSNQSMLILGKDGDMKAVQYSFAGMSEVYQQFQMDVAGAAEDTITHLFGRTITGLGQTNDSDELLYEQRIAKEQSNHLRPNLDKLFPVILMSDFGEVPDDLDMSFPSIRVLTEEEKAELVTKASAPILAAYDSGVIGRKTAMQELQALGETTNVFTNITDEQINEAEEEPELPGEELLAGIEGKGPSPGHPERPQSILRKTGAADAVVADARSLHKRIVWHGLDISIENEAGSTRKGKDKGGNDWEVTLTHDYGYLRNTRGTDGDHVDVFVGPDPNSEEVYVIHTMKAPDFMEFDEDKCFVNFGSQAEARAAFYSNYDRPEHFGSMEILPVGKFIDRVLATKKRPQMIRS
jgi:phage-related protein (TIGR01555 family)